MSKSLLLSIKPQYVAKILNKEKTIEVRKRFPLNYRGWVYIYCTKGKEELWFLNQGAKSQVCKLFRDVTANDNKLYEKEWTCNNKLNGKVVARFYCDKVEEIEFVNMQQQTIGFSCEVSDEDSYYCTNEMREKILLTKSCLSFDDIDYYLKRKNGYAIHISQLEIFDKPKELSEFYKIGHYEDFNDYFTDEKRINGKWCIPLTKAPQSMMYIEVVE